MTDLDEYVREGKWTVRPGDRVSVSGTRREDGRVSERGWTGKLVRLDEAADGTLVAVVTAPQGRAGVRHVRPERLTKRAR